MHGRFDALRTKSYETARGLWRQYRVASRLVSVCTYLLAWIVVTEVLFEIAVAGRTRPDLDVSGMVTMLSGQAIDSTYEVSVLALGWFAVSAGPLVFLIFRGFHFFVVAGTQIDQEHDRRHVAYAWSCAVIGLLCVLTEALGFLDFESEDLLIGIGGVNMLVEEIRLLEAKYKGDVS